jgi:hypothetical protein
MNLHGKNFIGDQLSTGTGETASVTSPLDHAPLTPAFFQSGAADVDRAAQLAPPCWNALPTKSWRSAMI